MAIRKRKKKAQANMSFLDHLEELRWHLIRSTLAVLFGAIFGFIFKRFIFNSILLAPKDTHFITYRILCRISQYFDQTDSYCIAQIPIKIISRKMPGQFNMSVWTAIAAGFIVAFPYILYELWRFISPALKEKERKASKGFIIIASLLFFIGVLFGYYVISPLSINFLGSYSVSEQIHNNIDLISYIGLIKTASLASGLVFELPIIIYVLTKIGLVTPESLRKYRKFALVAILIIAAIITPPDVTSMVIVSIPILLLYEVSIYISKIVVKREEKRAKRQASE